MLRMLPARAVGRSGGMWQAVQVFVRGVRRRRLSVSAVAPCWLSRKRNKAELTIVVTAAICRLAHKYAQMQHPLFRHVRALWLSAGHRGESVRQDPYTAAEGHLDPAGIAGRTALSLRTTAQA